MPVTISSKDLSFLKCACLWEYMPSICQCAQRSETVSEALGLQFQAVVSRQTRGLGTEWKNSESSQPRSHRSGSTDTTFSRYFQPALKVEPRGVAPVDTGTRCISLSHTTSTVPCLCTLCHLWRCSFLIAGFPNISFFFRSRTFWSFEGSLEAHRLFFFFLKKNTKKNKNKLSKTTSNYTNLNLVLETSPIRS